MSSVLILFYYFLNSEYVLYVSFSYTFHQYKGVGMRILTGAALIVSVLFVAVHADVKMSGAGAVEFTKFADDESKDNIDKSFIRGEVKAKGTLEKSDLEMLIHLRVQPSFTEGTKETPIQPRQVYLKMPASVLEFVMGRWYDIYGPGYYYFGRYLHGVKAAGSGSMNTDYSVIDGLKLNINIDAIKSAFQFGFLPQDASFNDAYVLAMFGGSPVEGLKFNIGGNFEALTPEDEDGIHRFIVNAGYTFVKEMNMGLFGEMAIVDFDDVPSNMWFLVGYTTKVGPVLDRLQAEFEIKNFRNGATNTDQNLAWMILLRKKVAGLCFDLNFGADPQVLKSETAGDVGAILRISAKF